MRTTKRGRVTARASYRESESSPEPGSPERDQEWAPGITEADHGAASALLQYAGRRTVPAAPRQGSAADGSWGSGGSGSGGHDGGHAQSAAPQLEEWEEAELALLSPESQKRERRRIANRDCARRIRQRQTELLGELGAGVEELQADNSRLLATLAEVTRAWRDTALENCELRAQIALLAAGGSAGSRSVGSGSGGGSGSDLGSPLGGLDRLGGGLGLSPGWGGSPTGMLM